MKLNELIDKIKINTFSITCNSAIVLGLLTNDSKYAKIAYAWGLAGSSISILSQNRRYDRLKEAIEENGFDERLCAKFMRKPCGRNVVKTVLQRTGNLNKYSYLQTKYPLRTLI